MMTKAEILASGRQLARKVGIYFLIRDGEIIYVGKSTNILGRLFMHQTEGKAFDAWSWVACDVASLEETESAYVKELQPVLNVEFRGQHTRPVITPKGTFRRIGLAAAAHKITNGAVYANIKRGNNGWSYG